MILVCGEALIDLFARPPVGLAIPTEAVAGGSAFIAALGVARLGCPAGFLGGLSTDRLGDALAAMLAQEGVDLRFAARLTSPTRLAVIATDAAGVPAYSFYGALPADQAYAAADLPPRLPDDVTAVAMSSFALMAQPVGAAMLALAQRESARRVVSVDPNMRAALIGDPGTWSERFDAFVRAATIVKASEEDIAIAYGGERTIEQAAAHWLAQGAALVVVTRGPQGAVAFRPNGSVAVPGRPVAVIDTVGAGDTFHAALLVRLSEKGLLSRTAIAGLDAAALEDAVAFAVAASSITCARRGGDLPDRAAVEAALAAWRR